jgi:hypothetical protein
MMMEKKQKLPRTPVTGTGYASLTQPTTGRPALTACDALSPRKRPSPLRC